MTGNEAYKELVDQLVRLSESQSARKVERGLWQQVDDSRSKRAKFAALANLTDQVQAKTVARNEVLASLNGIQRSEIARIVSEERTSAIHDMLAFLHDAGYSLSHNGSQFELSPFGTGPHFDYLARLNGDDWPS